jgi:hypothetical protein
MKGGTAIARSGGLVLVAVFACAGLAGNAEAAKKKPKPVPPPPAAPVAPPVAPMPAAPPPPVQPAPPPPVVPAPVAPAPSPAATPEKPKSTPPPVAAQPPVAPEEKPKPKRRKATFEGFFLSLNLGYATAGGKDGPVIPSPYDNTFPVNGLSFAQWAQTGCVFPGRLCYAKAVTTNKGAGFAPNLQIGYNIKGFVSLWTDLSWHGSFGSKVDTAGNGTVAAMLGLHPLRFWRDDLPIDVRLYGGYGFFDVAYYYEAEMQAEAKGKAWTGTALPLGLALEYKLDEDGVFALGADLRTVEATYDRWIFNYDKDITSKLTTPETTSRTEGRMSFGWHF